MPFSIFISVFCRLEKPGCARNAHREIMLAANKRRCSNPLFIRISPILNDIAFDFSLDLQDAHLIDADRLVLGQVIDLVVAYVESFPEPEKTVVKRLGRWMERKDERPL